MEELRIQNIITKKLLGEASSEETLILEQWRAESEGNENLFQEYASIWNSSANYEAPEFRPNAEAAYQKHLELLANEEVKVVQLEPEVQRAPKSTSVFQLFTMQRVAAIAALFVVVFGAMVVFNSMNTTAIHSGDSISFVSLEDGSSVWLDEGSTLSFDSGFGEYHRNITLDGKAFFDVKKNKDLEFAISSNDLTVSVLGTSFTVDTKEGVNMVAVKSGKVSVSAHDKNITLLPNEKTRLVNNAFVNEAALAEDISWRNSDLSFDNARLDQVISDINLYHNDKIVLDTESKDIDCPFTSRSLKQTPFENIIEILKITYDLQVNENPDNGEVVLLISDCK